MAYMCVTDVIGALALMGTDPVLLCLGMGPVSSLNRADYVARDLIYENMNEVFREIPSLFSAFPSGETFPF